MLLFIGNFLPTPRYNKNVWHFLTERLASAGWSVITTSSNERQLPRLAEMLRTIWQKRHLYQAAHIDVFSGKAFIYAYLSTQLLRILKKTIVITLHGGGLVEFATKHPNSFRLVITNADAVVTPSAYLQEAFTEIRSDIRLIPNPIDLSESLYRERTSATPRLIWVRAFHSVYNPCMAVRVLTLLSKEYPDINLLMVGPDKGDGSLEQSLKLAGQLGIRSNIEIAGHIAHSDIPHWLDKADIFINTSNYDTAPRSLLEAMANGLCVISTNVGGIPLLASDGVETLLVNPNDTESMAEKIGQILKEPDLAVQLSQNARIRAEKSDWAEILPKWDALFSELTNTNSQLKE